MRLHLAHTSPKGKPLASQCAEKRAEDPLQVGPFDCLVSGILTWGICWAFPAQGFLGFGYTAAEGHGLSWASAGKVFLSGSLEVDFQIPCSARRGRQEDSSNPFGFEPTSISLTAAQPASPGEPTQLCSKKSETWNI